MHATTGRWKLGLALALVTAVCWGLLPIALRIVLDGMDAWTITWYRFAVAIARYLGSSTTIAPVTSDRIRRPAPRPAYSVLSGDRYAALTGERMPRWEDALYHYLAHRSAAPGAAA